uniref:hypothetical protein n=1 Tax=Streptomyces sp. KL116D TaxID=3045152 RepID=UPI00355759B3
MSELRSIIRSMTRFVDVSLPSLKSAHPVAFRSQGGACPDTPDRAAPGHRMFLISQYDREYALCP